RHAGRGGACPGVADDERAQLVLMSAGGCGAQGAGREQRNETTKHESSSTETRLTRGVSGAEVTLGFPEQFRGTTTSAVRRGAGLLGALERRVCDLVARKLRKQGNDTHRCHRCDQRKRRGAERTQAVIATRGVVSLAG